MLKKIGHSATATTPVVSGTLTPENPFRLSDASDPSREFPLTFTALLTVASLTDVLVVDLFYSRVHH